MCISGLRTARMLQIGRNCVCILVSYYNVTEPETLTIKWGIAKCDVNSTDHISSMFAVGIVDVPVYRDKRIVKWGVRLCRTGFGLTYRVSRCR